MKGEFTVDHICGMTFDTPIRFYKTIGEFQKAKPLITLDKGFIANPRRGILPWNAFKINEYLIH